MMYFFNDFKVVLTDLQFSALLFNSLGLILTVKAATVLSAHRRSNPLSPQSRSRRFRGRSGSGGGNSHWTITHVFKLLNMLCVALNLYLESAAASTYRFLFIHILLKLYVTELSELLCIWRTLSILLHFVADECFSSDDFPSIVCASVFVCVSVHVSKWKREANPVRHDVWFPSTYQTQPPRFASVPTISTN